MDYRLEFLNMIIYLCNKCKCLEMYYLLVFCLVLFIFRYRFLEVSSFCNMIVVLKFLFVGILMYFYDEVLIRY